jgi:uncharacterized phiE125 gp8 family phage protein
MNITVVTPPLFEPVTVAEAAQHLRWDPELEGSPPEEVFPLQSLLERNIRTAREFVEKGTRRALVEQTIRLSGSAWGSAPGGRFRDCRRYVELLRPPLIEVLSLQYYDGANVLQTVDPANYYVSDDLVPRLYTSTGYAFPMFYERDDAVRVTYRVGYAPEAASPMTQKAAAANVPSMLKDAILLHVQILSDRFDRNEREDLERARDALITHNRVHTFSA